MKVYALYMILYVKEVLSILIGILAFFIRTRLLLRTCSICNIQVLALLPSDKCLKVYRCAMLRAYAQR